MIFQAKYKLTVFTLAVSLFTFPFGVKPKERCR